ncbi:MAG: hypothetical protein KIS62_15160 [Ramlibacter sp.]|nr:hypothetical protein [Ramlibacter sp.]MBX3659847.1 hypothetical protein [Ramlibacter sp.]MCW5651084.1 hypothetical protein [Ramlibacter sp.]
MSKSRPIEFVQELLQPVAHHAEMPWHDQVTQKVPLSIPEAQWASDDELDVLLGGLIWRERRALRKRVSHWLSRNTLLAVVDTLAWRVALRPRVTKEHLPDAGFVARPSSAATPPDGFRSLPLDDLLWKFGLYGAASPEVLPRGFAGRAVALRQLPQISEGLLAPRHLSLMRMLGAQALTLEELRTRLEANREDLLRDLTALYLTRSLDVR